MAKGATASSERYGFHDEARTGATRWVEDNIAVYQQHGQLRMDERGTAPADAKARIEKRRQADHLYSISGQCGPGISYQNSQENPTIGPD